MGVVRESRKFSGHPSTGRIARLSLRQHYRRRRRGLGGKYFSGNYYVKFGHFSGKNHVKFGNFVNFSGKYHKNSGILIIFWGQESCKIRAFCWFFNTYFSGKNFVPPKVDWAPTPITSYSYSQRQTLQLAILTLCGNLEMSGILSNYSVDSTHFGHVVRTDNMGYVFNASLHGCTIGVCG